MILYKATTSNVNFSYLCKPFTHNKYIHWSNRLNISPLMANCHLMLVKLRQGEMLRSPWFFTLWIRFNATRHCRSDRWIVCRETVVLSCLIFWLVQLNRNEYEHELWFYVVTITSTLYCTRKSRKKNDDDYTLSNDVSYSSLIFNFIFFYKVSAHEREFLNRKLSEDSVDNLLCSLRRL